MRQAFQAIGVITVAFALLGSACNRDMLSLLADGSVPADGSVGGDPGSPPPVDSAVGSCTDGVQNGGESDVDCGGSCAPCADDKSCRAAGDCASGNCEASICAPKPPVTFAPPVSIPVGEAPRVIAAGDVNGDGLPDIVVGSTSITILLGKGQGRFAVQPSLVIAGSRIGALALGDFDGDRDLDIAVATWAINEGKPGDVWLLINQAKGVFRAPYSVAAVADAGAMQMVVTDLNGDGRLDLVRAGGAWNTQILYGNGDGSFAAPSRLAGAGTSVAAADLDGDGWKDLVALSFRALSVFMADGKGGFLAARSFTVPAAWVATGDFNGDRKADLFAAVSDDVAVLLGNGGGSFEMAEGVGLRPDVALVVSVDLNGDGFDDVVSPNRSENSVQIAMGAAAKVHRVFARPAGDKPIAAAVADFDVDGRPDIAVANAESSQVTVLLQVAP